MGILIDKVLIIAKQNNIQNYEEFISTFKLSDRMKSVIQIIMNLFLLISFYVMIAGFGAYFSQQWQIPSYIGIAIIILLCYKILLGNIETLMKVNTFLVPILILALLMLAGNNLNLGVLIQEPVGETTLARAIGKAILYTSYNSIVLIPILLSLAGCIKQKTQIKQIALICTILLIFLAISVFCLIQTIDIDISKIELPTVYVAGTMHKSYQILYGIIILAAIYTSAISAGYGFLEKYQTKQKQYKRNLIIMCAVAFFVSKVGFTTLVNLLYPICGVLGFLQMLIILLAKKIQRHTKKPL